MRFHVQNVPLDSAAYIKAQLTDAGGGIVGSPFQGDVTTYGLRAQNGDFRRALADELAALVSASSDNAVKTAAAAASKTSADLSTDILTKSSQGPTIDCKQSRCAKSQNCFNYAGDQTTLPSECARAAVYTVAFPKGAPSYCSTTSSETFTAAPGLTDTPYYANAAATTSSGVAPGSATGAGTATTTTTRICTTTAAPTTTTAAPSGGRKSCHLKVGRIVVHMFDGKWAHVVVWWGSESVMFSMHGDRIYDRFSLV